MKSKKKEDQNLVASNKKARHDYEILDTIESGIVLTGTEIKSVRQHKVNLKDGFAKIRNGEAWLENIHISEYENGNQYNHDPIRNRKLLLHHRQISNLEASVAQAGLTIVPLKMYIKRGFAKVLLGVAKGKHSYDKRNTLKQRDQERQIKRDLANQYKY